MTRMERIRHNLDMMNDLLVRLKAAKPKLRLIKNTNTGEIV